MKIHSDTKIALIPAAVGPVGGVVRVPGSKSITNRALLLAAMAEGESLLTGALFSDDTHYMSLALGQAGVEVQPDPEKEQFRVRGNGGVPGPVEERLFLGNAGTAMRFLTGYFTLGQGSYILDGSARMRERPIQELLDALSSLGAGVKAEKGNGCPPVLVQGGELEGGHASVPGRRSSQFLSSLLLSAPYARKPVELDVVGSLTSRPYIDLTLDVMSAFGIEVANQDYQHFSIQPGRYHARNYAVEPDASTASYFLAAAAITGGCITIQGLHSGSRQGDLEFAHLLEKMGCSLQDSAEGLTLRGGQELRGLDVDMNACSDVSLTMAVVAPFCSTPTHIRNVGHIRLQETDRIHAMVTELDRAGIPVEEREDGFSVYPARPHAATFETYEDHRVAMSLVLIGLRTPGCAIRNPGCVSKTFPAFFETLKSVL